MSTRPPSADDRAAWDYVRRLARIEAQRTRETSGLLLALALGREAELSRATKAP